MVKGESGRLRIYCICGKKMKVTPAMYGRPGKCVACRQKLRVPEASEIPEGAREIHLRDHPEFLRKPAPRKSASREAVREAAPPEPSEVPAPELGQEEAGESVPIDVFEPLRVLYSLDKKVERQLAALEQLTEEENGGEERSANKSELLERLNEIEAARENLDHLLRQRLMEVAIELASVEEKLGEVDVSARVGDLSFDEYERRAAKLRARRDVLIRRRVNLRGWLALEDLHMAGGYRDADFAEIPNDLTQIAFPHAEEIKGPLAQNYCKALREALTERERLERRLQKARRLDDGAQHGGAKSGEDVRRECETRLQRTEAWLRYIRDRLQQLHADRKADLEMLRQTSAKSAKGAAHESQQAMVQREEALRAELAAIAKALGAHTPGDVPQTGGHEAQPAPQPAGEAELPPLEAAPVEESERTMPTFAGISLDAGLAWMAAAFLVAAPFLPVADGQNVMGIFSDVIGLDISNHWLLTGPLLLGASVAVLAFIPMQALRSGLLLAAGVLGSLAAAIYLYAVLLHDPGPLGELFADAGVFSPGLVLYISGMILLGLGGSIGLWEFTRLRPAIPLAILAVVAGLGLILTDFAGMLRPEPGVSYQAEFETRGGRFNYSTVITLENTGYRTLLLAPGSRQPNAFSFLLEEQVEGGMWRDLSEPRAVEAARQQASAAGGGIPRVALPPGEKAALTYRLEPGAYRVVASSNRRPMDAAVESFTLEPPDPALVARLEEEEAQPAGEPDEPAEPEPADEPEDDEETDEPVEEAPRREHVLAELRGMVGVEGRGRWFSMRLLHPDGTEEENRLTLGDNLYDEWRLQEFNPERQTLAISDGAHILILRRGVSVPLAPPPAARDGGAG
ncbi:MAG: hypothetical protein ACLFV4_12515 [Candidatus Hydrogenedentota bacterium]